jgi:hypothetical protein
MDARFSIASSTTSIPRYRTVESWVGQQTIQVEDQRFQEQLKQQIVVAVEEVDEDINISPKVHLGSPRLPPMERRESEDTLPSMPDLPARFASAKRVNDPALPPCPPAPGVPEKDIKEDEAKTRHTTQGSDAPIFRAHPGTEVRIPRGTFIPSEILDGKISPNAF